MIRFLIWVFVGFRSSSPYTKTKKQLPEWVAAYLSGDSVRIPSTSVPDASGIRRTLPRAKKCPPDTFCTGVRTGTALSSPSFHNTKKEERH